MKVKISELIGPALDWAVAKCEGWESGWRPSCQHNFSTDWFHGGPIIEREMISVMWDTGNSCWNADCDHGIIVVSWGPTPLIAAMRCYVASKLGDKVEVPEELK